MSRLQGRYVNCYFHCLLSCDLCHSHAVLTIVSRSEKCGSKSNSCMIFVESATVSATSPGRRSFMIIGKSTPEILLTILTTSLFVEPFPVPTLYTYSPFFSSSFLSVKT